MSEQLSDEELKEIRDMLQSERRVRWLWSSVRVWSIWIAGVFTALAVSWDFVINIVKHAVGK